MFLTDGECATVAESGTDFYLFEGLGVGMNIEPIRKMVEAGSSVNIVVCKNDEHDRISYDALGMGVINWALSGRAEPYASDIYTFIHLTPDSTYSRN